MQPVPDAFDLVVAHSYDALDAVLSTDLVKGEVPRLILDSEEWRSEVGALRASHALVVAEPTVPLGPVLEFISRWNMRRGVGVSVLFVGDGSLDDRALVLLRTGIASRQALTAQVIPLRRGAGVLIRQAAGEAATSSALSTLLCVLANGRPTRLPLRVAYIGPAGLAWLGGWAEDIPLRGGHRTGLIEQVGAYLDLVVVDAVPAGFAPDEVHAALEQARALGASIVGIAETGHPEPVWHGRVDHQVRFDHPPIPCIDATATSRIGFREANQDLVIPVWDPGLMTPELVSALRARAPGPVSEIVHMTMESVPTTLRGAAAVLDEAALHGSDQDRAGRLVHLAAAGVPVVIVDEPSESVRSALGEDLAQLLTSFKPLLLADSLERQRFSVALRRLVRETHSLAGTWRELTTALRLPIRHQPSASVILCTNRMTFLEHAVAQLNAQTYTPREAVVVLHGDSFSDTVQHELAAAINGPAVVLRRPSSNTLGDALNAGLDAAAGQIISKMDDDDWYAEAHLSDMIDALESSGAHLVGKGPEFVFLAADNVTIHRPGGGGERRSTFVAGGTLTGYQSTFDAVGGFRRVNVGEDQRLLNDVAAAGLAIYRTHGFGYLLHRHGSHTWEAPTEYFEAAAAQRRPGLALQWAMG